MKNLKNYRDLILVLTNKEIKIRYKNTFLGYLWSIANPLAFAFVFYIAFKVVMRIEMENYT
ncbi:MAG: ABC transporter permease, partial [Thermodesulfobacteriota bacterium]